MESLLQPFHKLRRIFDRATKTRLLILMIAIGAAGFLEMLVLAMIAPFIAIIMNPSAIHDNAIISWIYNLFGFTNTNAFLAFLAVILAFIYIIRGVYLYVLHRVKFRFLARRQAMLSERLLDKIMSFSYLYHTEHNTSELGRIVSGDAKNMFVMIHSLLFLLTDFFMAFFIFVFLLISSPAITIIMVGLAGVCVLLYFKAFHHKIQELSEKSREAQLITTKAFYQALWGIKDVKLLQREEHFKKAYQIGNEQSISATTQYQTLNTVPKLAIEIVCFGGAFAVLALVLLFADTNIMWHLPQLGVFVLAAFRILPAIARLTNHANTFLYNRIYVDGVYNSLFEEVDIAAGMPSNETAPYSRDITIQNLTFKYPRGNEPVLKNITLTIPENKSVAFVGPSGAGKTTLADLILGVFVPDDGAVYHEGKSIHANFKAWSKNVGYIPQRIYLLDESIRANVAFGIKPKEIDDAKVWRALEQAQLADFVRSLPNGMNTMAGERGVRFSGGQQQRVGIARALYNDPPILVLDEATSSLDNDTEAAVMEAIKGFQGQKTMIIVAHRLSTIEHCDMVYEVDNKKVKQVR